MERLRMTYYHAHEVELTWPQYNSGNFDHLGLPLMTLAEFRAAVRQQNREAMFQPINIDELEPLRLAV